MPAKIEEDEDEDVEVIGSRNGSHEGKQEVTEYDNMLYAKENEAKRKKADELSKKMGEKLLQGWAMLEDSCFGLHLWNINILKKLNFRLYVPINEIKKGRNCLCWLWAC